MDAMKLMNNLLEGCNSVVDEPAVPEVILPCHACGGDDTAAWEYVVCKQCYARGPICKTREVAIAAWNTLPRALRWTHEPPKVAGWYWCTDVDRTQGYPIVSHYDEWAIESVLPGLNDGKIRFLWAGPLRRPLEA